MPRYHVTVDVKKFIIQPTSKTLHDIRKEICKVASIPDHADIQMWESEFDDWASVQSDADLPDKGRLKVEVGECPGPTSPVVSVPSSVVSTVVDPHPLGPTHPNLPEHPIEPPPVQPPSFPGMHASDNINILIMGDSGVGKSTAVNGFINCFSYQTLDEAETGELVFPIPMTIKTIDAETYEEREISVGTDVNECYSTAGQSVTQYPQTFVVMPHPGIVVSLIDTPGLNDTRGRSQDEKNVEITLAHLAYMKTLNAIMILLNPDLNRMSESFVFCLTKILANLHESAKNNIVFLITRSRQCNFRPGGSVQILKTFLRNNKLDGVNVSPNTVFFVDNEAIPYLIGFKNGVKYGQRERDAAIESWSESAKSIEQLLQYVMSLKPVQISDVVSLQSARQTIISIAEPLMQVACCIGQSIKEIEDKKRELDKIQLKYDGFVSPDVIRQDIAQMEKNLMRKVYELDTVALCGRCLICTTTSCGKMEHGHPIPKVCQEYTNLAPSERFCNVMTGVFSRTCTACRCSSGTHQFRAYLSKVIEKEVRDDEKMKELSELRINLTESTDGRIDCEKMKKTLKDQLDSWAQKADSYKKEQREMVETSATLTVFQEANAIFRQTEQDKLTVYFDDQIKALTAAGDTSTLSIMREMKSDYQKGLEAEKKRTRQLTPGEIYQRIEKMYTLPNFGQNLKKNVEAIQKGNAENLRADKKIELASTNPTLKDTFHRHRKP